MLSIDIETYSDLDLAEVGVYKYAEQVTVLLVAYAYDGEEVKVVDLAAGEVLPEKLVRDIKDTTVLKSAFNAQFERVILSAYLNTHLDPHAWRCTMVHASYLGLPQSLAGVGSVLNLEQQKLSEGKRLIQRFCTPQGDCLFRNVDDPEWELFKEYNKRDVEVERELQRKLSVFPVPETEWEAYARDQEINDRGVKVDLDFVESALGGAVRAREECLSEARNLTGLNNPNSVSQLISWLNVRGLKCEELGKQTVQDLLARDDIDATTRRVLELRTLLGKASVKKYDAIKKCVCSDGRLRGMFRFYGSRTGRFTGRLVQLQNLPQNHIDDIELARELVKTRNYDAVEMLYDSLPSSLSELIRTTFVGHFTVADFSAIEARVLAWLAGEQWRTEVFKSGGDIYCASASKMFGVPVEKHGVNGHLRQKGKVAELALGYGGATGALKAMGALRMGIPEEELPEIVRSWRESNRMVCRLWSRVGNAAATAILRHKRVEVGHLVFRYEKKTLIITLPSGRELFYIHPTVKGEDRIFYMGVGRDRKWGECETYGAKLVENIIQAVARDLLVAAMLKIDNIVMHVHDEIIVEDGISVDEMTRVMCDAPAWAEGLVLNADGYNCEFYRKD